MRQVFDFNQKSFNASILDSRSLERVSFWVDNKCKRPTSGNLLQIKNKVLTKIVLTNENFYFFSVLFKKQDPEGNFLWKKMYINRKNLRRFKQ